MLDSFGLDINMFGKEYFNREEDEKQFYEIADILLKNKSSKLEYGGLKLIHLFSPGDACPICDAEMMPGDSKVASKHCVCHACGLESKLSHSGKYELNMDEFSWELVLIKAEMDDESTELFKEVKASQGDMFALYRLLLNGNKIENVDEKMETMKTDIQSLCDSLTKLLHGKLLEMKKTGLNVDVKNVAGKLELDDVIQQYFSQK